MLQGVLLENNPPPTKIENFEGEKRTSNGSSMARVSVQGCWTKTSVKVVAQLLVFIFIHPVHRATIYATILLRIIPLHETLRNYDQYHWFFGIHCYKVFTALIENFIVLRGQISTYIYIYRYIYIHIDIYIYTYIYIYHTFLIQSRKTFQSVDLGSFEKYAMWPKARAGWNKILM